MKTIKFEELSQPAAIQQAAVQTIRHMIDGFLDSLYEEVEYFIETTVQPLAGSQLPKTSLMDIQTLQWSVGTSSYDENEINVNLEYLLFPENAIDFVRSSRSNVLADQRSLHASERNLVRLDEFIKRAQDDLSVMTDVELLERYDFISGTPNISTEDVRSQLVLIVDAYRQPVRLAVDSLVYTNTNDFKQLSSLPYFRDVIKFKNPEFDEIFTIGVSGLVYTSNELVRRILDNFATTCELNLQEQYDHLLELEKTIQYEFRGRADYRAALCEVDDYATALDLRYTVDGTLSEEDFE